MRTIKIINENSIKSIDLFPANTKPGWQYTTLYDTIITDGSTGWVSDDKESNDWLRVHGYLSK